MSDRQACDTEWEVRDQDGSIPWSRVDIAVLMDIRRELRKLNSLLGCHNFTSIPSILRSIQRNTAKPRKRKSTKGVQR